MWRMRVLEGRWGCNGSPGRSRAGLAAAGSYRRFWAEDFCEAVAVQEGWRGLPRGSPQQLAERYADLAASHCEALRLREQKESDNVRLRLENTRLRLESRRLRRENRRLFQQVLPGPDAVSDEPATSDPAAEAEALRVQLERLQEKHRRALQHLRRCRAAGGLAVSELDDGELDKLLEEDEEEEEDQQPLEKRSLVPAV